MDLKAAAVEQEKRFVPVPLVDRPFAFNGFVHVQFCVPSGIKSIRILEHREFGT